MTFPRVRLTVRRTMALVVLLAIGLAIARHISARWGPCEAMTVAPMR